MNYIYAGAELKVITAIDFTVSDEDPHHVEEEPSFQDNENSDF